ncbi:MAG: type II and III secretion system protein family protein [Dongiaceae bacterium]
MVPVVALLLVPHPAAAQVSVTVESGPAIHAGEFVVPINKSELIQVDQPFKELLVGNPDVADVLALTNQTIYILGRTLGATNLTIYGENRQLMAVVDIVVSYDVAGLKAKLYEVMPEENIEVRSANGSILISGSVSTSARATEAMEIALRYAPEAVTNSMTVEGSQQVMLQVRFAEVNRSAVRELGIGNIIDAGGDAFTLVTTGALPLPAAGAAFGIATASINTNGFDMLSTLRALERRGLVRTLAEPNLVALSGDTAYFLAGGEFPIPVAQDEDTITVEFKEFGVGLGFTPTVIGKDLINLEVAPEVSRIDATITVQTGDVVIPGLSTRRARTTIELRDGQSFAIAGLLQSDFQDAIEGLPWLSDIPILGLLFSSRGYQRNETELVIVVTPRLVQPARSPDELALPTDSVILPTDAELFLLGRTEGQRGDGDYIQTAVPDDAGSSPGGLTGQYGYIIK